MGRKFLNMNPRVPPATLFSTQEHPACGWFPAGFIPLLPKPLLVSSVRVTPAPLPPTLGHCTGLTLHRTNTLSRDEVQWWLLCPLKALWWVGNYLLFNINIQRLNVYPFCTEIFHHVILSSTCSISSHNKNFNFMRKVHRNLCVT